eukprot:2760563-Lingulodinium_polyedra.AAC.1
MPYRLLPSADVGCSAAHRKIGSPRLLLISLRHFSLMLCTAVSTESCVMGTPSSSRTSAAPRRRL